MNENRDGRTAEEIINRIVNEIDSRKLLKQIVPHSIFLSHTTHVTVPMSFVIGDTYQFPHGEAKQKSVNYETVVPAEIIEASTRDGGEPAMLALQRAWVFHEVTNQFDKLAFGDVVGSTNPERSTSNSTYWVMHPARLIEAQKDYQFSMSLDWDKPVHQSIAGTWRGAPVFKSEQVPNEGAVLLDTEFNRLMNPVATLSVNYESQIDAYKVQLYLSAFVLAGTFKS